MVLTAMDELQKVTAKKWTSNALLTRVHIEINENIHILLK
jgi:hypothetical protein